MIYIVNRYSDFLECETLDSVWSHEDVNMVEKYKSLLDEKAFEMALVINKHHSSIVMNHDLYNNHLSRREFNMKSKQWLKFLDDMTFEVYLKENGATKLEFKEYGL